MLQVVSCITEQHDLRLVVLAGIVCVLACLAAVTMLKRAEASPSRLRLFWISAAGVVAGCGIWSTHFIAMLAFQPGLPVAYDIGPTLLSVVIAVGMSALGFAIALRPGMVLIGGAVAGAAIGTMHFVGMTALRAPAVAVWDMNYVAASLTIGITLTVLALRALLRGRSYWHYAGAATLFALAICGLHFTAMTAVTYYPDSTVAIPQTVFDPSALAIMVASAAILIVVLGFVGALVDNHLVLRAREESHRLRRHVRELEATKAQLEKTSADLSSALVAAEAANKSKSEFLANMSHELRTPLNAVIGFSEVILRETFGPLQNERYHAYIEDIHGSSTHLLSLINDVLDLSRLDAGVVELDEEPIDVEAVISESVRFMAKQAAAAKVAVALAKGEALPRLSADRRRMRQILLNLMGNAVKFTPAGGSVSVGASRRKDGLAISVRDNGIGIASEHLPKVVERFYQIDSKLERKFEGAGLGLSLVKQFVELQGGSLEIESEVGVGTTATVLFPESRIVAAPAAAPDESAQSAPSVTKAA